MKELFYAPDLDSDVQVLAGDQFRHAIKVMRKREGDTLLFTDGRGTIADVKLTAVGKREARFEVRNTRVVTKRTFEVTVAVAPTKNLKRIEWALEKMVEFGIDRFVPITTEHSERINVKADRLETIAISAMKQSQQAFLPKVESVSPLIDHLEKEAQREVLKLICYKHANSSRITDNYRREQNVSFLIGPEGDFSAKEVELARAVGFVPVLLGSNRLRTESAAVMAVAAVHTLNM